MRCPAIRAGVVVLRHRSRTGQDTRSALEPAVPIHHLFHGEGGDAAQNGLAQRAAEDLVDPSTLTLCLRLLSLLGRRLVVSTAKQTAEKIVEWKMEGDEDAALTRILLAVAWVVAYLAALFLTGFMIATPIYVLLYMLIHGGRSLRDSALAAAATTLTIWLTFVVLFRYPLYPGVLFGGY